MAFCAQATLVLHIPTMQSYLRWAPSVPMLKPIPIADSTVLFTHNALPFVHFMPLNTSEPILPPTSEGTKTGNWLPTVATEPYFYLRRSLQVYGHFEFLLLLLTFPQRSWITCRFHVYYCFWGCIIKKSWSPTSPWGSGPSWGTCGASATMWKVQNNLVYVIESVESKNKIIVSALTIGFRGKLGGPLEPV